MFHRSLREDRTLFLFVFTNGPGEFDPPKDSDARKALLRRRLGEVGWESSRILDELDHADAVIPIASARFTCNPGRVDVSRLSAMPHFALR